MKAVCMPFWPKCNAPMLGALHCAQGCTSDHSIAPPLSTNVGIWGLPTFTFWGLQKWARGPEWAIFDAKNDRKWGGFTPCSKT